MIKPWKKTPKKNPIMQIARIVVTVLTVFVLSFPAGAAKGGQPGNVGRGEYDGREKNGGTSVTVPANYVRVILFYAKDGKPDKKYEKAVDPFVQNIRDFYREKTGGETFYALPMKVIKGQKNADEYSIPTASNPDGAAWANIYTELGIDCASNTNIVTLMFLDRTLQHGNGRTCSPSWYNPVYNGDVTISISDLDPDVTGVCPDVLPENYWYQCNKTVRQRAVAHELGHALSLSHPDCSLTINGQSYCDLSIMYSYWNLDAGFIDEPTTAPEISTLRASPWFN